MSEAVDPEDVDRLLAEYAERARRVIESHGGIVEKSIGDAVVGVFGVPTVHEDDAERAVRAGLRLVGEVAGLKRFDGTPLQVQIGIDTGEALVRLDVDPASGQGFLTGDAVNVAARLQAAAPPGGVAVGALTRELTVRTIDYEAPEPLAAAGEGQPTAAFLAKASVSLVGVDVDRAQLTPLVGRCISGGRWLAKAPVARGVSTSIALSSRLSSAERSSSRSCSRCSTRPCPRRRRSSPSCSASRASARAVWCRSSSPTSTLGRR